VNPVSSAAFEHLKAEDMIAIYVDGRPYLAALEKKNGYTELAMYALNYVSFYHSCDLTLELQ